MGLRAAAWMVAATLLLCRQVESVSVGGGEQIQYVRANMRRMKEKVGYKPTSRSYAAGLSSDNELSSLRGVRHF